MTRPDFFNGCEDVKEQKMKAFIGMGADGGDL
jgi:hypothetical protein